MQRQNDSGPIRLTNKTALALRKSARQERTLALSTAVILTLVLAVLAVVLGIRWLFAVPLLTAVAVLLDAAIVVRGRSRYISLTGQAICAEAAARQLRADRSEKDRRAQAKRDLESVKADVLSTVSDAQQAEKEKEEEFVPRQPDETASLQSGRDEPEDARERDMQESREEPEEAQDAAGAQGAVGAPVATAHRRRRQASLTVLRAEDVK